MVGGFSTKQELEPVDMYLLIEFADSRRGDCIVSIDLERRREGERLASNYYYRFYGRGKLGWRL